LGKSHEEPMEKETAEPKESPRRLSALSAHLLAISREVLRRSASGPYRTLIFDMMPRPDRVGWCPTRRFSGQQVDVLRHQHVSIDAEIETASCLSIGQGGTPVNIFQRFTADVPARGNGPTGPIRPVALSLSSDFSPANRWPRDAPEIATAPAPELASVSLKADRSIKPRDRNGMRTGARKPAALPTNFC
jgi:hypothetical protein